MTDAAAVKSGGSRNQNKNGYHHEAREEHEGRKDCFQIRFLLTLSDLRDLRDLRGEQM